MIPGTRRADSLLWMTTLNSLVQQWLLSSVWVTAHTLSYKEFNNPHAGPAGTMSKKEIEENYAISRRIEAEERALETATMVLTSTQQEIDEQWGLYDG